MSARTIRRVALASLISAKTPRRPNVTGKDGAPSDPTQVVIRRCLAYAADLALVALVLVAVLVVAGDVTKAPDGCPSPVPPKHFCIAYRSTGYVVRSSALGWCALTAVILVVLVFLVPEAIAGASPGRTLLGVRVVRSNGRPPGLLRSTIRAFAWIVDGITLLLPVGLWLIVLTPQHRRVGDYAAGTYVVRRSALGRPVPRSTRRLWPSGRDRTRRT